MKEKITQILKIVGVVAVIVLLGWVAFTFKANIGSLIARIRGDRKNRIKPTKVTKENGEDIGVIAPIVRNTNPLRDKSSVELKNGLSVQLPKGMKDKDVDKVAIVKGEINVIAKKHTKLTDIFD